MDALTQVTIGVIAALVAAAPVAFITRRVNGDGQVSNNQTIIAGGDVKIIRRTKLTQTLIYNDFRTYIKNESSSSGNGSPTAPEGWTPVVLTGIAAVVGAAIFAAFSQYFLIASVSIVSTLVISSALLVSATRREFGRLMPQAISALSHVGLTIIVTTSVWALVLTTDRHGVSLHAASAATQSAGEGIQLSAMVDFFDIGQLVGIGFLFFAVVIALLVAISAAVDLGNWAMTISILRNCATGRAPNGWQIRRADAFHRLKPVKTLAPSALLGLVAVFLASGLLSEWTYSSIPTGSLLETYSSNLVP